MLTAAHCIFGSTIYVAVNINWKIIKLSLLTRKERWGGNTNDKCRNRAGNSCILDIEINASAKLALFDIPQGYRI